MDNQEKIFSEKMRWVAAEDPQTYRIIGAALEVHRELGAGFVESVYQEALALEFDERLIPFRREVEIPIRYKWQTLSCMFRADFICFNEIIVELKALRTVGGLEQAQVFNYLKGTGYRRGVLLNFGAPSLQFHRLFLPEKQNVSFESF